MSAYAVLSQFSFEAIGGMLFLRAPYAKRGRAPRVVSFTGAHVPQEILVPGVRWYVAYALSPRPGEELLRERGVHVDHSPINRSYKGRFFEK